jgi:hypothetical protein
VALAAASALCALAAAQAGGSFAAVRNLQLPGGWRPTSAALADLDGDKHEDVVVAAHERGKPFARELQLWRPSGSGASYSLSERLPLTPDVVAWTVGDVREGGGAEIVLFTATGAFSWRLAGPPEERLERLAALEFLWQLPEPHECFHIDHLVRDIDGDGLSDLAVPGPHGYTAIVQRRPRTAERAFGVASSLRVPLEDDAQGPWISASPSEGASVRGRRRTTELSLRVGSDDLAEDGEAPARVLVQVNESVPMAQWIDWDGDGRLDVLAQTSHRLHVWRQSAEASFPEAPELSLALPVAADRTRRLDASYSSHAVELDGDKRADCVVFAGDKRSEDVRTQGLVFTQRAVKDGPPLFGANGRPSDLLVFGGFVSGPSFRDLDGDGLVDLSLRAVRPDLIDQLRSAANESIDAELYIYRNLGGRFSKQPDLMWRHSIPIERFQLTSSFCGDLTGDKLSELLVRDRPEELRVLMLRAAPRGGAWSVLERPLWTLAIDARSDLEFVEARPGGKPRVLVIEPNQVLHVSFP